MRDLLDLAQVVAEERELLVVMQTEVPVETSRGFPFELVEAIPVPRMVESPERKMGLAPSDGTAGRDLEWRDDVGRGGIDRRRRKADRMAKSLRRALSLLDVS